MGNLKQTLSTLKNKKWLYLGLLIIISVLLTRIALTLFAEPWIGKKLETTLSEKIQITKYIYQKLIFRLFPEG